jgi:TM2 domain-containing membrane protein YozV
MSTCANHPETVTAAYCRTCGKALCDACKRDVRGLIYCEDCIAARVQDTIPAAAPGVYVPPPRQTPSPALATLLGFIPGVGAVYNGQFAKAFVHVIIFSSLVWAANRVDFFGAIAAFFYFYMVIDAYKTARAMELGQPLPDLIGLSRLIGNEWQGAPMPPPATPNPAGRVGFVPVNSAAPPGVPASPSMQGAPPAVAAPEPRSGPPIGAIILIGLGVIFLLDNLGMWHFHWFGRMWPVILIAMGVWLFMRRSSSPPRAQ